MKNVKFISGFSIFGFLLSIVSSFGSHRVFGMKIVLAIIFAVVFGACAFLISYLYTNFLEGESSNGFGDVAAANNSSAPSSGVHAVDITVQDEDLPSEENENQFFVGSKHQMLNDGDLSSVKENSPENEASLDKIKMENQNSSTVQPASFGPASSVSDSPAENNNSGFVPVSLAENADNFSSIESKSAEEVKRDEKVAAMTSMPVMEAPAGSSNGELDVLPDLEEISAPQVSSAVHDDGMAEGTEFTESKNISGGSGTSAEDVTQGKDTELIAKAISTLLAKD